MDNQETICALATATGGAIAVIRISGPQSFEVLSRVFKKKSTKEAMDSWKANTIYYGEIVRQSVILDEVLVSVFRAPHSYTGEDCVEISCHGSSYITRQIINFLIESGCRMATPGEYTMRAYLNGKMDLSQAEAVADLIASTNRATHQLAMGQLKGHFSTELSNLRKQLLKLTSLLELELDFSDHEELEFADRSELENLAETIKAKIKKLTDSFRVGQAIKQGIPVAIAGKTNAGKSTLLNQLVGDERAIVSNVHGTTRDTIEETMDINGIQFRFIDTAGIRKTNDEIEQIGINRTLKKIKEASIVIWLFDQRPTCKELDEIKEQCSGKKCIYVQNKADKIDIKNFNPYILPLLLISAKTGEGISRLKEKIFEEANLQDFMENDVIVTNARHYQALLCAQDSLNSVIEGLKSNLSVDLLSEDLRQTLEQLAEIAGGQITPQETLNNIFSHFCVGK